MLHELLEILLYMTFVYPSPHLLIYSLIDFSHFVLIGIYFIILSVPQYCWMYYVIQMFPILATGGSFSRLLCSFLRSPIFAMYVCVCVCMLCMGRAGTHFIPLHVLVHAV